MFSLNVLIVLMDFHAEYKCTGAEWGQSVLSTRWIKKKKKKKKSEWVVFYFLMLFLFLEWNSAFFHCVSWTTDMERILEIFTSWQVSLRDASLIKRVSFLFFWYMNRPTCPQCWWRGTWIYFQCHCFADNYVVNTQKHPNICPYLDWY